MKLTVKSIKTLRRDSDNKLFRRVCSWVIEHWSNYSDKAKTILNSTKGVNKQWLQ